MSREELNIGALPGRKRKALSITTFHDGGGASIEPIAYFQSEEAYEHFRRLLKGRGLVQLPAESQPREPRRPRMNNEHGPVRIITSVGHYHLQHQSKYSWQEVTDAIAKQKPLWCDSGVGLTGGPWQCVFYPAQIVVIA